MRELLDEGLIEKLRSSIKGFVGNRIRDHALAEDITHDVLLKISTRLDSLDKAERIEAWAFRIARNSIADYFRSAKPTERFQEDVHSKESVCPPRRQRRSMRSIAYEAKSPLIFDRSSRPFPRFTGKRCFSRNMTGLSQVELANRLGLSVSAAKSRVQRARAVLKAQIERCCRWSTDRYGSVIDVQARTPGDCEGC